MPWRHLPAGHTHTIAQKITASIWYDIRQKFFVDRVIHVWTALPSKLTANFTTINVLGTALKRLIFLVFLFVIFYLCGRPSYVPSNCFIERLRAAVSVLVGPCCPALLNNCIDVHRESKKTKHLTLAHNFTKYWPIFKILSLLDSVGHL